MSFLRSVDQMPQDPWNSRSLTFFFVKTDFIHPEKHFDGQSRERASRSEFAGRTENPQ